MRTVLHEFASSGNCYKIRLTAAHLGRAIERQQYDIFQGETRTPQFLTRINANGRIPVLQVGDRFLPESNAACVFLADGSDLIPRDAFDRADMLHWMFWEQYNHEPNVATLRFWRTYLGEDRLDPLQRQLVPSKEAAGSEALALMDRHLATHDYLVGPSLTLADIALYAYTHVADTGGFDLAGFPAVSAWLSRVAGHPRHVSIEA